VRSPRGRRVLLVSAAIIGGIATVAAIALWVLRVPLSGGPLAGLPAFGYAVEQSSDGAVTDALTLLSVPDDIRDPVELVRVEQAYESPGLEDAGSWAAGADRSRELAVVEQFYRDAPPDDPRLGAIRPIAGVVVPRKTDDPFGVQLLLASRVTQEGRFVRSGVWVTYTYRTLTFRDFIPAVLTVCTPAGLTNGECEPDYGDAADDTDGADDDG
jgi:hypothetical protein